MASLTLNPNDDRGEETVGIVEDKNDDDDDDVPQLSANALAALQEFLQERQAQLEEEEEEAGTTAVTALQLDDQTQQQQQLRHVSEDWQLSQFWYTESTAIALAKEALAAAGENGRVACVSCPTLYKALVDVVKDEAASGVAAASADSSTPSVGSPSSRRAIVLEFDRRFAKWGADFVFYDYKDDSIPELPVDWRNSFDVVVCDPPFLTEDCAAATLKAAEETLGKKPLSTSTSTASPTCKVMFCTGEIMEETLRKLSDGALRKSETFVPEHASKLSNPFVLMTNFDTTTL